MFYKKYGAITSKIAKCGSCAERSTRRTVHGHAAAETESLQDDGWKVLARQARWTFPHVAARWCTSATRYHPWAEPIAARAEAVWDEQLDERGLPQGMETAATIGRPEAVVEQGQCSDWRHHSCA